MRISDWSSDVCSSDLGFCELRWSSMRGRAGRPESQRHITSLDFQTEYLARICCRVCVNMQFATVPYWPMESSSASNAPILDLSPIRAPRPSRHEPYCSRSEEQTSELQSLKGISYSVLCT